MPIRKNAAVVTGASSGIGKVVLEKISERFKTCYNLDINPPSDNSSFYIHSDIADIEDVNEAVEKFTQSGNKLEALILCAGIGVHEKLAEGDPLKWKRVIDTNLVGNLNVLRAFIPFMDEGGDIIFLSSVAAGQPYEYGGVYAATKTALNVIAETLRLETGENIRVSIVEPGSVETNFMKNTISGARDEKDLPFGSLKPDSVAQSVIFILDQPAGVSVNKLILRPSDQSF
jgi:NADP-dependent 3-hydroxy acid dehydrogenase YdfG